MSGEENLKAKDFVDFSFASQTYAKFRPEYPQELFDEILHRLKDSHRELAVDIGAGTGQASIPLTKYFKKVLAFDPSPGQLAQAAIAPNLEFKCGTAEKIEVPNESVDLLVAAQAAHWFPLCKFFPEAQRVLKPHALMALWCYDVCSLDNPDSNEALKNYYFHEVGPYFNPNRKLIDDKYVNIVPTFGRIERKEMSMQKTMDMSTLIGYLSTWSGLDNYKKANPNKPDPLQNLIKRIESNIGKDGKVTLTFPIYIIFVTNE